MQISPISNTHDTILDSIVSGSYFLSPFSKGSGADGNSIGVHFSTEGSFFTADLGAGITAQVHGNQRTAMEEDFQDDTLCLFQVVVCTMNEDDSRCSHCGLAGVPAGQKCPDCHRISV